MSISINCIFTQSFKDLLNALLGTGNTAVNKVTKILSLWCLYCSGGEERQYNCVYIKSNLEKKNKAGKGDRVCTCVCVCAHVYTHDFGYPVKILRRYKDKARARTMWNY